jgi:hypothetical protein
LAFAGCQSPAAGPPVAGCTQLDGLSRIALTGRFVYAIAAAGGGTVVRFKAEKR